MIAPSAAFAKHESIVRAMRRSRAREAIFMFPLLPHELREVAELNIGLNSAKSADVLSGQLVRAPRPN